MIICQLYGKEAVLDGDEWKYSDSKDTESNLQRISDAVNLEGYHPNIEYEKAKQVMEILSGEIVEVISPPPADVDEDEIDY